MRILLFTPLVSGEYGVHGKAFCQYHVRVVDPSALHLAIAASFAPLQNQGFISTVVITGNTQIAISFSARAPQNLGEKLVQELSEMWVSLTHSGLKVDLSSFTSREQIHSVGSRVEEILIATGSTVTGPAGSTKSGAGQLDQRDREFLDNVPPHHGV